MSITIDNAGRLVIPKPIRDRFNLTVGSQLEIEVTGTEIRLRPAGMEPSLIRKQGVLVHHGSTTSDIDIASFIDRQREQNAASKVETP